MSTATAMRLAESQTLGQFASSFQAAQAKPPARISLNPDDVKNGLAKIALTVVELLRGAAGNGRRSVAPRPVPLRDDEGGTAGQRISATVRANGATENGIRLAGRGFEPGPRPPRETDLTNRRGERK